MMTRRIAIKILVLTAIFLNMPAYALRPDNDYNLQHYTVLGANQYTKIVHRSRSRIQQLLATLKSYRTQDSNQQIAFIAEQLSDIPYVHTGAMGEGDWEPTSTTYRAGALHIQQDPVYRLDGLNCLTFVQVTMALFYSNSIDQFDKNILKISYHSSGQLSTNMVHLFNRNNFIDADWNPANHKNGFIKDITDEDAPFTKITYATIDREHFFSKQLNDSTHNVRVLVSHDGPLMRQRFKSIFSRLRTENIASENIAINYTPKELFITKNSDETYSPNHALFQKIPTPAIIEIIRDAKQWRIGRKSIKELIGSETTVSHLGLIFRKTFKQNELIYRKTVCTYDAYHQAICDVKAIHCHARFCNELMFAHATNAYPNAYYWYALPNKQYTCSASPPSYPTHYTRCNRTIQTPLFDYLTDKQYGFYAFIQDPSILGVHIEKLI